jgi:hypothetical protein
MTIGLVATAVLVGVFLVSAASKVRDLGSFSSALTATYGIPGPAARPLRVVVPIVEFGIAVGLIIEPTRGLALIWALSFLLVVLMVASSAYLAGRTGDCGCFGDLIQEQLGRGTLARLCGLLVVCAIGLAGQLGYVGNGPLLPAYLLAAFSGGGQLGRYRGSE